MTTSEEELEYDPIISFYLKISQSNENDGDTPLFNETMLRLSFKEVFGKMRPIISDELSLYRKLLLLYYSINYTSMTDLSAIMTCFDEHIIPTCLRNRERILMTWFQFYNKTVSSVVFREASNQILYEYTIRHINLFGHITKDQIKIQAGDIRKFLGCQPKPSLNYFNSMLKNKLQLAQNRNYEKLTVDDLKLQNIYQSIKHKLNYFVVKEMSEVACTSEDEEPLSKKTIQTVSNVVNTSIEVIQPNVNEFHSHIEDEIKSNNIALKGMSEVVLISEDEEPQRKKTRKMDSYVVNASIQVIQPNVNESDSNIEDEIETSQNTHDKLYVYDNIDDEISYIEVNDEDDIEEQSQGIFQQFDEASTESNEHADVIDEVNDHIDNADNNDESQHVVDYNTAIEYLTALQAYAVANEHSEAIELLNSVDSIFRKKSYEELFSYFI